MQLASTYLSSLPVNPATYQLINQSTFCAAALHSQPLPLTLPAKRKDMSNRTFTMIKPDAFSKGYAGAILERICKDGFRIVAMKLTKLSAEKAGEFYAIHKQRPFYGELVEFMSSGPIIAAILEKNDAVADFRKLIGATDPAKADPGTIRKLYAASVGENAVHGSDSDENAIIESDFFFSGLERF
jgi:nucleoside-diphosphate kinase